MILRKPYALFIKNFRLLHIIMTVLMGYLLIRTSELLGFFNDFLSSSLTTIGLGTSSAYFNSYTFIVPAIIMILSILILSLMIFKGKPALFYAINTIITIYLLVVYSFARSNMMTLELHAIDIRVLRAIRDLLMGGMLVEIYSFIITFIRATGFDIRKFNFGQDLEEMQVNEADREEFEVEVSFDPDKFKSRYRRFIRNLRYAYYENKFITDVIMSSLVVVIIFLLLLNNYLFNRTYKENNYFSSLGITMKITDSYVTTKDYYDNVISEDKAFLVLKAEFKSIGATRLLSTSKMDLKIGNIVYRPSTIYNDEFIDLGDPYVRQEITSTAKKYIFIYEISKTHMNRTMTFRYNSSVGLDEKYINVSLSPIYLDDDVKTTEYELGTTIDFKDSILKNSKLTIKNFSMAGVYMLTYNYCAASNDCYTSYEYVAPSISGNQDKGVFSLSMDYSVDETLNISDIETKNGLLEVFGHIIYIDQDGVEHKQDMQIKGIELAKYKVENEYYYEILSDVVYAKSAKLVIKVRNYEYIYNLVYQE